MITSSCPRMKTCSQAMEQERRPPSAPLPWDEGAAWCEWSRRAQPGPSTTPWWPALHQALRAQTRAPPTARTRTLPSWTQMTCEQNPVSYHPDTELPRCERTEGAVFGWALPELLLAKKVAHVDCDASSHKYLIICLFACLLCHSLPL